MENNNWEYVKNKFLNAKSNSEYRHNAWETLHDIFKKNTEGKNLFEGQEMKPEFEILYSKLGCTNAETAMEYHDNITEEAFEILENTIPNSLSELREKIDLIEGYLGRDGMKSDLAWLVRDIKLLSSN